MRDYKEYRTLCSLQLLMESRKNHCRSMRPNSLASAGISLRVCFCSDHFISIWEGYFDFAILLKENMRSMGLFLIYIYIYITK
jgi:hypothetical protein